MKFALSKIKTADEFCHLKQTILFARKIVFTNGCFDILHTGHLTYLNKAASLGDILVIGMNTDDSVRRLKGKDRPINSQLDRAIALGALAFVDYIIMFDEDTPLTLIKKIMPDVLVKGADYKPEDIVGASEVIENGGAVETISLVEAKSTTNIISKIKNSYSCPSISIMIPALNEGEVLDSVLNDVINVLNQYSIKWQLALVNDGSSDNTGSIMDSYKNKYQDKIIVIHHPSSYGLGRCFREALKVAEMQYFTWFPSDGENDPSDIVRYLFLTNYIDILIPFAVNKGVRSIFRRIISSLYLMIINVTFGTMFNYTNGNIIYKKSLLENIILTSNSFFFQTETLIKTVRLNKDVMFAEVPIILKKRGNGKSKAFKLKNIIALIKDYCRLIVDIHLIDRFTNKYKGRI